MNRYILDACALLALLRNDPGADKVANAINSADYGETEIKNDPQRIAGLFHSLLKGEQLERNFERIVFAVYDTRGDQYSIFKNWFACN